MRMPLVDYLFGISSEGRLMDTILIKADASLKTIDPVFLSLRPPESLK